MFASLAAKLIPYKTIIIIGIILITLGSGWLYVHNLKSNNAQLTIDNTTLIENNKILSTERDKWVKAMQEQKVYTDTLESDKISSDSSIAALRGKLNVLRGNMKKLHAQSGMVADVARVVGETVDDNNPKPITESEVSTAFMIEYQNSLNCISAASGHEVTWNE